MILKTSLLLTLQKHCWGTRGRAAKGTLVLRKGVNMKVEDVLIQLEEIILEHRKQFRTDVLKVVNDIELRDSIALSNEDINDIADALIMVAHLKVLGAMERKQCITCRCPRKSFEEELQEVFEKNKYTHVGYSDKAMCE